MYVKRESALITLKISASLIFSIDVAAPGLNIKYRL